MNEDYRETLKSELLRRMNVNSSYNLSAFARDLKMSRSSLSEVLAEKHGISEKRADEIISILGLSSKEGEVFKLSVSSSHGRSPKIREKSKKQLMMLLKDSKIKEIDLEVFETIANWHHYAILELTELACFDSSHEWIARYLGIKVELVDDAVERLLKLNLLTLRDGGVYVATDHATHSPEEVPSKFIKDHHCQILTKASRSIYTQPIHKRHYVSSTVSINEKDIEWVKEEIEEFRDRIIKRLNQNQKKENVYNLSVQFFSLLEGGIQ